VLVALVLLVTPVTTSAELIHFTSIVNDERSGSSSIPFPRSVSLNMANPDSYVPIEVYSDITELDVGQTIIADRSAIGTDGWQRINGLLSNGNPDTALLIEVRGGGRSIGKACLFLGNEPCNGYVTQPNWVPPNGIDLAGYHIDEFWLTVNSLSFSGGDGVATANAYTFNYTLRFYGSAGQVPEPSAVLLFAIAFCNFCLHHHTPVFRRQ